MVKAMTDFGDQGKIAGIACILSLNFAHGKRLCNWVL